MSPHIGSHREYVVARLAVRKLTRSIRKLREQLLAEADPISYYSTLTDIALAEAQLDDFCAQIGEWQMRGGCVVPRYKPRSRCA